MRAIWKYACNVESWTVKMPKGAEIIAFGEQHGVLTFWAMVDDSQPKEEAVFVVVPTGAEVPDENRSRYVGSCKQLEGGRMVHLFELLLPSQGD